MSDGGGGAERVEDQFAPEVVRLYERLDREAKEGGYHLNPDKEFTLRLVEGLHANLKRYGYMQCPCRLAFGEKAKDLDAICPCFYRDADVVEHGACYCALYVSEEWIAGRIPPRSIPERRPQEFIDQGYAAAPRESSGAVAAGMSQLPYPVWRCQVCGYLAARDGPPEICPVCKARKDRFERFL